LFLLKIILENGLRWISRDEPYIAQYEEGLDLDGVGHDA